MENKKQRLETFAEFCKTLGDVQQKVLNEITTLLTEMGGNVEIPDDIDEYDCCNEICYMGGRHPEYASNVFERYSSVHLNHNKLFNREDIIIKFNYGEEQLLVDNGIDDIISVLEVLLTIKYEYKENTEK
jgi:hypothetical protein